MFLNWRVLSFSLKLNSAFSTIGKVTADKITAKLVIIQNNQALGKGYQPQSLASADKPYLDLDYSAYQKNPILFKK